MLKTSHVGAWVVLLLCLFSPMSQAANTATETDKEYTFTLKSWTVTQTTEHANPGNLRGEYRITFGNTTHCFDHQLVYEPNKNSEGNKHEGWIGWKKQRESGCGKAKVLYGKQQPLGEAFDLERKFAKQKGNRYKTTSHFEYVLTWKKYSRDYPYSSPKHTNYEFHSSLPQNENCDQVYHEVEDGAKWYGWYYKEDKNRPHSSGGGGFLKKCQKTITAHNKLGPLTLYQPDPNGSVFLYPQIHANGYESIPFIVWQMDYNGFRVSKDELYHRQKPYWKTGVFKLTARALVALDKDKDGVIELPLNKLRTEQITLTLGYVAKPQLPQTLKDDIAALEKVLSYTAKQNLQQAKKQWAAQAKYLRSQRKALLPKTLRGIDAVFLDAPSLLKNHKNPWRVPNNAALHPKILGWIKTQAPNNARWLFKNKRQEVGTAAITENLTQLKWMAMPKPQKAQSVELYYFLENRVTQPKIQSRCRPLYQIILSSDFERLKKQQALLVFKRQYACKGEVVALNPLRTIKTADFRRTRSLTIRKPSGITDDFFSKTYSGLTLALRWQGQRKLTTIRVTKADVAKGFVSLPKGNYSLSHSSSNTQDNLTLAIVKDSEDFWVPKLTTASTLFFALMSDSAFKKQQWRLEVDYPTGLDDYTWKKLCPIDIKHATLTEWIDYLNNGAQVVCPYLQETLKVTPKLDGQTIEVDLGGHRIRFLLGFKDTRYSIADWTIQLKNQSVLNISDQAVHLGYVEMRVFDLFPNQQSTQFKLLSPKLIYKDMPVSLTHDQQKVLFKNPHRRPGLYAWPQKQQSQPQKLSLDLNNPTARLAETQVDSNGLWPLMSLNIQLANGTTLTGCRIKTPRIRCSNKTNLTLEELAGARLTLKELGDSVRLSKTPTDLAIKAVYCGHWSRLFRAQLGRLVIQGASHDTDHLYTVKPDQMELYFTPMPGGKNWWRLDVGTEYLGIPIDGLRRSDRYFHGGASDKPRKDRWCDTFAELKPVQSPAAQPFDYNGSSIPPMQIDDQTLHLSLVFVNYDGNWNHFWNQPQMKKTLLAVFQKHQNKPVEISLWFAKPKSTQQIEFESRSTVTIKEVITSEAVYDKIHAPISDHLSKEPREIAKPIQTILTQFKAERRWSANSDHIVVLFAHKLEPDDLQFDWSPLTTANGLRHFVILSTKRIAKRIRKQLSKKGVTVIRFRGQWLDALKKDLDNFFQKN